MNTEPTRVLLVEGDADEVALVRSYLAAPAEAGPAFVLTEASRLSTARHLLARQEFDVVLLDLALPLSVGLDGFQKIREMKPGTPVVLLTGQHDEFLAIRARESGAADYVIKGSPDFLLLKRVVRHAIERARLRGEIAGLLEADDAPKAVVDAKGVVRYANPPAAVALGRAREELVGAPFGRALPEAEGEVEIDVPRSPEGRMSARVRPISWNGAPARLVTLREPSANERLRTLQAEMKEGLRVVEIKNHFMNRISHEMRNTLSALKTSAYCLKDGVAGALTPRQGRLVDIISRNVDRQTRIIENILDVARFQSGKLKIQFRQADVAGTIAEIVQEYGLWAEDAAKIRVDVDADLPIIKGDPELIGQVVRNLLNNALRFAKKRVVVAASKADGDQIALSVTDDGPGIPANRFGELFTEFARLDPADGAASNAHGHKGTGLGLTICKEIVQGHRGKIWAENGAGGGARFNVLLPVRSRNESLFLDDERVFVPAGGPAPKAPPVIYQS